MLGAALMHRIWQWTARCRGQWVATSHDQVAAQKQTTTQCSVNLQQSYDMATGTQQTGTQL